MGVITVVVDNLGEKRVGDLKRGCGWRWGPGKGEGSVR